MKHTQNSSKDRSYSGARNRNGKSSRPSFTKKKTYNNNPKIKSNSNFNNKLKPSNEKKKGPSPEALELSSKLKEFSVQKRLSEAIESYWDSSNNSIRDGHHACIVVDCCARCGNIQEGERIINHLVDSGKEVNIQTKTALLKGYAHGGQMQQAFKLYRKMMIDSSDGANQKKKSERPNVRTFNTLLRACLWTAASIETQESNNEGSKSIICTNDISGGVITGESIWPRSEDENDTNVIGKDNANSTKQKKNKKRKKKKVTDTPKINFGAGIVPDISSYEYSISLLSQALRCIDAEKRLDELKKQFNIQEDNSMSANSSTNLIYTAEDPSILETVAVSFLNIARANAMIDDTAKAKNHAKNALDAVSSMRLLNRSSNKDTSSEITNGEEKRKMKTLGGKRAWKASSTSATSTEDEDGLSRREESNSLFREHKLKELESDAKKVLDVLNSKRNSDDEQCANSTDKSRTDRALLLARHLMSRLLYYSGGGTTDLSASLSNEESDETSTKIDMQQDRRQLINSLWFSFGLSTAMQLAFPDESFHTHDQSNGTNNYTGVSTLSKAECSRILKALQMRTSHVLLPDGLINFPAVFENMSSYNLDTSKNEDKNSKGKKERDVKRPLNIELGSGYGEWAVHQAQLNSDADYVAVELRSDRVGQTFSKAFLNDGYNPIENLACVGSECGSFLKSRVRPGSVSKIFVNYPEPPTQTFGANNTVLDAISNGGEEPGHMLNSETLFSISRCLDKTTGQLIIVSDNRWYANLICATLLKVLNKDESTFFNIHLDPSSGIHQIEEFHNQSKSSKVILYEGQPNESIGHLMQSKNQSISQGSTYFDRLWRTNASIHADVRKRFIICMSKSRPRGSLQKKTIASKVASPIFQPNEVRTDTKEKKRNKKRHKKSSSSKEKK